MQSDRSFSISRVSAVPGNKAVPMGPGRYISKTPQGAAKKVFSTVIKNILCGNKATKTLLISVQETTRGSLGKTFKYKVYKESIKPVLVMGNDKRPPVIYKFKTIAVAV